MNRSLKKTALICACLIISLSATPDVAGDISKTSKGYQQVKTVPFCDLAKHPERYTDKLVRTTGIFLTHFPDVWFMYDENCSDRSSRATGYLNCKSEAACGRLRRLSALHRDGDGERWRNQMAVVGELHIVELQNRSGGHNRALKFGITDIESVSVVPQSAPWPEP